MIDPVHDVVALLLAIVHRRHLMMASHDAVLILLLRPLLPQVRYLVPRRVSSLAESHLTSTPHQSPFLIVCRLHTRPAVGLWHDTHNHKPVVAPIVPDGSLPPGCGRDGGAHYRRG